MQINVDKHVLFKGKVITLLHVKNYMADKIKHDFYVPVVRQVALRNGHSTKNFSQERTFISFSIVKNDQKYPNKMIVCSGGRLWYFIQGLNVSNFIW